MGSSALASPDDESHGPSFKVVRTPPTPANGDSYDTITTNQLITAPFADPQIPLPPQDFNSVLPSSTAISREPPTTVVSSAVVHAVSRGCSTAAVCITEAQKRASDLLASAAGFLARPLSAAIASGRRTPLDIRALVEGGVPEIVVLGHSYRVDRSDDQAEFLEDYYSRTTFTYRRNFVPIDFVSSFHLSSSSTKSVGSDATQLNGKSHSDNSSGEASSVSNGIMSDRPRQDSPTQNAASALFPPESASSSSSCASITEQPPVSVPFFQRVLSRNTAGQIVSDAGWGCMIRATQMAIAQSLMTLRLGRDWRRRKRRKRGTPDINQQSTNHSDNVNSNANTGTVGHPTCLSSSPLSTPHSTDASPPSQDINHEISTPISSDPPSITPSSSLQSSHSLFQSTPTFTQIITLFADHPDYPLSVHNIARLGALNYGIPIGQWLGPTSCAQAAASMMTAPRFISQFSDITPVVFPDGLLIHSTVKSLLQPSSHSQDSKPPTSSSVLIILCMRLGADRFNTERYRTPLARCFRLAQFQGLAGGGSQTSAHFFFGICARGLLYLDPHIAVQPAFSPHLLLQTSPSLNSNALNSPPFPRHINSSSISPPCNDHNRNGIPHQSHSQNDHQQLSGHTNNTTNSTTSSQSDPSSNLNSSHNSNNSDSSSSDDQNTKSSFPPTRTSPSSSNGSSSTSGLNFSTEDDYDHFILPYEFQFFPLIEQSADLGPSVCPWSSLNPSMALYFLCRNLDEYQSLIDHLKSFSINAPELFEMRDSPLDFSRAAQLDLDQFNLEDEDQDTD